MFSKTRFILKKMQELIKLILSKINENTSLYPKKINDHVNNPRKRSSNEKFQCNLFYKNLLYNKKTALN